MEMNECNEWEMTGKRCKDDAIHSNESKPNHYEIDKGCKHIYHLAISKIEQTRHT